LSEEELMERIRALAAEGKRPTAIGRELGLTVTRLYYLMGKAGIPLPRRVRGEEFQFAGVRVKDWEALRPILEYPGAQELLTKAIAEARRRGGSGWMASGGLLVTVELSYGRLVTAGLYARQAEYVAPELREEVKNESPP
jgi:hypothetical protein